MPVPAMAIVGQPKTHTNRSGSITSGGVAQQLMAANARRTGFLVQNVSDTDMWVSWIGTASAGQPSLKLVAGALYETKDTACPQTAISIFCATTGKEFTATEWE